MTNPRGFYLMHRGWLDHPALADGEFCRRAMWADMIEMAAWRTHRRSIAGKTIELQRGEFTASLRFLAARWGCSKAKVERLVSRLKTETMIETRTETGQLIIRVCNYEKFQRVQDETETPSETPNETEAGQDRDSSETKEKESNSGNTMNLSLFEREGKSTGSPPAKRPRRKPQTELPADFVMPAEWIEWAQSQYPQFVISDVSQQFIAHHQAKGSVMRDWRAAWRTWLINEVKYGKRSTAGPPARDHGATIAAFASAARRSGRGA